MNPKATIKPKYTTIPIPSKISCTQSVRVHTELYDNFSNIVLVITITDHATVKLSGKLNPTKLVTTLIYFP